MSEPELSLQQANAAAQREKIRRKLSATIVQIRREIRGTADALTGRCRYIVDRGDGPKQFKLSRREVLRRVVRIDVDTDQVAPIAASVGESPRDVAVAAAPPELARDPALGIFLETQRHPPRAARDRADRKSSRRDALDESFRRDSRERRR